MQPIQIAHNDNFTVLVMIIKGRNGDQHKILTWNLNSMFSEGMWEQECWIWTELGINEEGKRHEAVEEFRPSTTFL
jgi:hypothetical protein